MTTLDDVLTEIGTMAEGDFTLPSGRVVRIRELTAAERLAVSQAANIDGKFDATLFNAMLVQAGTTDPIIPKTAISRFVDGRAGVVARWSNAIWALSEATPEALKSGDPAPDDGQQDQGAGAPTPGAGADAGG